MDRRAHGSERGRLQCVTRSARRKQGRCEMVIVDYLQLMPDLPRTAKSTNDQISAITRQLKLIAKENDIPVVLLSQLNRNCEARPTLKNMLSDLRDGHRARRRYGVAASEHRRGPGDPSLHRGAGVPSLDHKGRSGEGAFRYNKGLLLHHGRPLTPVPNDRQTGRKLELKRFVRMIARDTFYYGYGETARIDEVAAGYSRYGAPARTSWRSALSTTSVTPRSGSARRSTSENASVAARRRPIRLVRHMEGCGFEEVVRLLWPACMVSGGGGTGYGRGGRTARGARQAILCGSEGLRPLPPSLRSPPRG